MNETGAVCFSLQTMGRQICGLAVTGHLRLKSYLSVCPTSVIPMESACPDIWTMLLNTLKINKEAEIWNM